MPELHDPLRCDLLVFDLDGTLVDSEADIANAVNASLVSLGRPVLPQPSIVSFIGEGAATLIDRALNATGGRSEHLSAQALSFFIEQYRHHLLDLTRAYPGVTEALEMLRAADPHLPMAVLTNKPVNPSRSICDGLGLSPFFFANYGGNSFPTRKPNPAGLHTIMAEASQLRGKPITPDRTVMVGDSHVDIETARAAGVRSLGCLYGLSPGTLQAAKPDAMAHSPADWLPQLRELMQATPVQSAATQPAASLR